MVKVSDPIKNAEGLNSYISYKVNTETTLEEYDYNQTHTAKALGVSRKTLIRLMKTMGFVRATDLDVDEIEDALNAHGRDIARVAQSLRISRRGLQLRMRQLGLISD